MAEALLKKLRKLEENMTCPNCGTKAQAGIGFGNICVKFKTFVCDSCKTSHQAISHRVKSITMSNWTLEEVLELTDQKGGGNNAALHVWLQKSPPIGQRYSGGIRPKSGDSIDIFKKFIVDCYELGKFKSSTPYIPSSNSGSISAPSSGKNKVSTFINNKSGSADDLIINHKRDDLDNQGSAIGLPFHDDTLQKLMIFDYGKVSAASTPSESPQKVSSSSSDGNALFDPFGTGNKSDFVATFPSTIPPTSTVPIDPFSSSSCTPFSSSVDDLLFSPAPVASSNASAAPAESYSFLAQTAPPAGPSVDPFGSSGLLQPTVLHNSESSSTPSNAFHPFASSATTTSYHPAAAGPLWNVPPSAPTFGDTLPMRPPMQTHSNSFGAYSQPPFRVMNPPPASSMSISQINIPTYDVRGGPAYSNRTAPGARSAPSQGNDSFNFVSNTIRSQLESSSNRF